MPLTADDLGKVTQPCVQAVDNRWLMAYAAGLGDRLPCYLDTTRADGICGHPVFPVALEWEPILRQADESWFPGALTFEERAVGVHAMHDLHLHQPVASGEGFTTHMWQIGVYEKAPGAFQVTRLETVDADGAPAFTTYMHNLFRGVALNGGDSWTEMPPPPPDFSAGSKEERRVVIKVPGNQAHVYTECARIWAPIHTDRAVALAAGLPDIILHGTCTLALAVSAVIRELDIDPTRVTRLGCRFSEIVLMPSELTLTTHRRTDHAVSFDLMTEGGAPALSGAYLCWRD